MCILPHLRIALAIGKIFGQDGFFKNKLYEGMKCILLGLQTIIKKSRWVSIHDGRPVSPYTETVTYEPAFPDRYS
ncbi:hypothetical protein ANCDUO_18917, partial [Ancylostoma duodenale]